MLIFIWQHLPCYGENRTYVSLNAGLLMPKEMHVDDVRFSFENSPVGVFALGQRFRDRFRGEVEFSLSKYKVDKAQFEGLTFSPDGDITSISLLVNGYLDFITDGPITPFLTAGVGGSRLSFSDMKVSGQTFGDGESDTDFTYQVGAGIEVALDKQVSIDLKYRYLVIRDDKEELPSHNLFFGVKVFFNSLLDSSD